jgi:hypothetical protein
MTTRFFLVDERGGLGDVVVALEAVPNGPPLTSSIPLRPILLDQSGCEFLPYILAIKTGQQLFVRNSDPVLHNVHVMPGLSGNPELNRAHPAGSPDLVFVFEAPELFLRIKCDVHPWMFAYVCVFEHAYFGVTHQAGWFVSTDERPSRRLYADGGAPEAAGDHEARHGPCWGIEHRRFRA